jgi:predicted helicase
MNSYRRNRRDKPGGSPVSDSSRAVQEISKRDIFYYVYGILHHPGYRTKFADNLKRELPPIPFAPDFWAFANAGRAVSEDPRPAHKSGLRFA